MGKPTLPQFPASFLLLQQEGYLMSSCLSLGLTEIRAAHVHNKGAFYTAFFNLSAGIERLLKVMVVIDHMLGNDLQVPSKAQLVKYGHNIVELYDKCAEIGSKRRTKISARNQLDPIDQELLELLCDFAKSIRYHNLDALSSAPIGLDPLDRWERVVSKVLREDVSESKKQRVLAQGSTIGNLLDDCTMPVMQGFDKTSLTTAQAVILPGLHELAAPFIVLRIVKILSQVKDVLSQVCCGVYALENPVPAFPQMQEFLSWIHDDRQSILKKRRWP